MAGKCRIVYQRKFLTATDVKKCLYTAGICYYKVSVSGCPKGRGGCGNR